MLASNPASILKSELPRLGNPLSIQNQQIRLQKCSTSGSVGVARPQPAVDHGGIDDGPGWSRRFRRDPSCDRQGERADRRIDDHARRIADAAMLVGLAPGPAHAELLGDVEAGRQGVLMEAVAAVAAAEEGVAHPLDGMQGALGADRGGIVHRMVEGEPLQRLPPACGRD